ncbi:hypothetical protein N9N00_01290 [Schleiferiaceae bacterium]|nr:hypothetical protein [Schleiferiaceae bacterium]
MIKKFIFGALALLSLTSSAQTFFLKSCLEGVRQQNPSGDVISDQMAKD